MMKTIFLAIMDARIKPKINVSARFAIIYALICLGKITPVKNEPNPIIIKLKYKLAPLENQFIKLRNWWF